MPLTSTAAEYRDLSDNDKMNFIYAFAFLNESHVNTRGEQYLSIYLNGNTSRSATFVEDVWQIISVDTQIAILNSLRDLDATALKHTYTSKSNVLYSGTWCGFAEHMIPRILERLFTPGIYSESQQENRGLFLHILANDSYYARLLEKSGLYAEPLAEAANGKLQKVYRHSLGLKYSTLVVNTLLNDKSLKEQLCTAAEAINTTFMLQLLKLRYTHEIESSYFEQAMLDSWKKMLINSKYEPVVIAERIKDILNYLSSFHFTGPETKLLTQFKECIAKHCADDRRIADCFHYRDYGIKLPGDPDKTSWLPGFDNINVKSFIAGAATAASVATATILLRA